MNDVKGVVFPVCMVTGRRDWNDREQVRAWLQSLSPSVVIVGGAPGADTLAAEEAHALNCEVITFAADWKTHGKAAGPLRNQRMIDEGKPDGCLAFYDGRGKGTKDAIVRCKRSGIPVLIVWREQSFPSYRA